MLKKQNENHPIIKILLQTHGSSSRKPANRLLSQFARRVLPLRKNQVTVIQVKMKESKRKQDFCLSLMQQWALLDKHPSSQRMSYPAAS